MMQLVLALMLFVQVQAQPAYGIKYRLAMPRPASHLFEVTIDITFPPNETATFVDLQMPMWQPGRYSVADFAANVQEFSVQSQNRALSWTKIDDQTWRVQRQGSRSLTAVYAAKISTLFSIIRIFFHGSVTRPAASTPPGPIGCT